MTRDELREKHELETALFASACESLETGVVKEETFKMAAEYGCLPEWSWTNTPPTRNGKEQGE